MRAGFGMLCGELQWVVIPDLLCCGKALGGGVPIAAVLGRRALLRSWEVPGEALHTSTFLGNPLACAAALAVLDILIEEDLPARAANLGEHPGARLRTFEGPLPAGDRRARPGPPLGGRANLARGGQAAGRRGPGTGGAPPRRRARGEGRADRAAAQHIDPGQLSVAVGILEETMGTDS